MKKKIIKEKMKKKMVKKNAPVRSRKKAKSDEEILISVIVKTYNEEEMIISCLESIIQGLKGISYELLVCDSLSTDTTVKRVHSFTKKNKLQSTIRVLQITHAQDRSCSVGPQMGFLEAKGKFLFMMDGDMTLDPSFVKKAMPSFDNWKVAAVAGKVESKGSSKQLTKHYHNNFKKYHFGPVDYLEGGALYRTSAIRILGYFTNRFLKANEEADLGLRLRSHHFILLRLNIPMHTHFLDEKDPGELLWKRFSSGYMRGPGQVLRSSIFTLAFYSHAARLRLYLGLFIWWSYGLISYILSPVILLPFELFLFTTLLFLLYLAYTKEPATLLFSLLSWHLRMIGLLQGFFLPPKNPRGELKYQVV